jgi:hypothetical protein
MHRLAGDRIIAGGVVGGFALQRGGDAYLKVDSRSFDVATAQSLAGAPVGMVAR